MSSILQVNLEDVLAAYKQRQLWNKTSLENIQFLYDGQPVDTLPIFTENGVEKPLTVEEWRYTGLNNIDFMLMLLEEIVPSFNEGYTFTSDVIIP